MFNSYIRIDLGLQNIEKNTTLSPRIFKMLLATKPSIAFGLESPLKKETEVKFKEN